MRRRRRRWNGGLGQRYRQAQGGLEADDAANSIEMHKNRSFQLKITVVAWVAGIADGVVLYGGGVDGRDPATRRLPGWVWVEKRQKVGSRVEGGGRWYGEGVGAVSMCPGKKSIQSDQDNVFV